MKEIRISFHNIRGITLIELLVGVVILAMTVGAICMVTITSLHSQRRSYEHSLNIEDGRRIIIAISNEIRNATTISYPPAGNNSYPYITFRKSGDTGAVDRRIAIGTGGDANTVVFSDTSGTITKRLGAGRIDKLEFTRIKISPSPSPSSASSINKVDVVLTIKRAPEINGYTNKISTVVYTLNAITD